MDTNLLNNKSFWSNTSTINKIMLVGFPTVLAGVAIWYFGFRNESVSAETKNSEGTKTTNVDTKPETKVSTPDANVKPSTTTPTNTNATVKPNVASVDVAGKKVTDALLKNDPKSLFGKKVYAYNDQTPVYTLQGKPYTKVKKGQLLGTFSNPKPLKEGGNTIVIVSSSNDPKNKFIVVKDAYLTF